MIQNLFSQYCFSIVSGRSTVVEVGWAFCNNAYVVGAVIKSIQFTIAAKSELDN